MIHSGRVNWRVGVGHSSSNSKFNSHCGAQFFADERGHSKSMSRMGSASGGVGQGGCTVQRAGGRRRAPRSRTWTEIASLHGLIKRPHTLRAVARAGTAITIRHTHPATPPPPSRREMMV